MEQARITFYDERPPSKTGGAGSVNKGRAGVAYPVAGAGPPDGSAVTGADNDMWDEHQPSAEINDGGFTAPDVLAASTSAVIDEIAVKVYYWDQTRKAYVTIRRRARLIKRSRLFTTR